MAAFNLKLGELKGTTVRDVRGAALGRVADFIIRTGAGVIDVEYLTVAGEGRVRAALPGKHAAEAVVAFDEIDRIEDEVHLLKEHDAPASLEERGISREKHLRFSELTKARVIDSGGFRIGHVLDVWLDEDGTTCLVLGGGFIEETLEKLHLRPDVDLLCPANWIESIGGGEVRLRWSGFQLESTCEKCHVEQKRRLVTASSSTGAGTRDRVLRLIPPRII